MFWGQHERLKRPRFLGWDDGRNADYAHNRHCHEDVRGNMSEEEEAARAAAPTSSSEKGNHLADAVLKPILKRRADT